MRIVAGKLKSRILKYPKSKDVRPTMDRVRETIFNIIGSDIENAEVLDLFAGSGSMGIEAISRGAKHAVFVDSGAESIKSITVNCDNFGIAENADIYRQDVVQAIPALSGSKCRFDFIFVDPPYGGDLLKKTLIQLYQFDILSHRCIIIAEHGAGELIPENKIYKVFRCKRFGKTSVSFIKKTEEVID